MPPRNPQQPGLSIPLSHGITEPRQPGSATPKSPDGGTPKPPAKVGESIATLSLASPIALLPVRIETRFGASDSGEAELWVRVYPDAILADQHDPRLTAAEASAGAAYWVQSAAGNAAVGWAALVGQMPSPRAAWVVRRTDPAGSAPVTAAERDDTSARGAQATLLPDSWVVRCMRDGAVVAEAESGPVRTPLALALGLSTSGDSLTDVSGDGLTVDPGLAWTLDFAAAEVAGMGIRVSIKNADPARGFDRLMVMGVRASAGADAGPGALADLFTAHHYADGFAFVAQGTPTNNTSLGSSGYPAQDTGGAESYVVEQGGSLATDDGDGRRFAAALGMAADVVSHVAGADATEQVAARAMAEALWPATIGYWLEQLMAPVFGAEAIAEAREYFVDRVRGRGPYAAFRVGGVPYGVLPTTSLDDWQPRKSEAGLRRDLPPALLRLREIWARSVDMAPRIARTGDPDHDLLETLGMDASAREARVRWAMGGDTQWNIFSLFGVDSTAWQSSQRLNLADLLRAIGHPDWTPRLATLNYAASASRFSGPFVATEPLSETDPLDFNYIEWLRTASLADIRSESLPDGAPESPSLLYLMLRHAFLREVSAAGDEALVLRGEADSGSLREPELVGIVPGALTSTAWARLDRRIEGVTGTVSLGVALTDPSIVTVLAQKARITRYRTALSVLAALSQAELERLFTETLDLCTHRLDAWITSVAAARLDDLRASGNTGTHIGAYGWVESLRPAQRSGTGEAGADTGGFVYAPSMAHAAAAAVLRSAYLTRGTDGTETYAIDLSSRRVRQALELLDGVREGQPLGALFGYDVERGLHEGHAPLELDRFIEPLRALYPLVAGKGGGATAGDASAAPRNVLDGLALRAAWTAGTIPWSAAALNPTGAEKAAIEAELAALDDSADAVSDLLTAESVFQVVRGSTDAATATLDSIAKGGRPPDPEVARLPRGGTSLVHRVALSLDTAATGWFGAPTTPRARAEPALNAWAASLLGSPRRVECRASYVDPADSTRTVVRQVTLDELALEPLDVIALAATIEATPFDNELDRRIAWLVRAGAGADVAVTIEYSPAGLDPATALAFRDLIEIARSIQQVLGGARAMRAEDLLPPEDAGLVTDANRRLSELAGRATAARTEMDGMSTTLAAAIAANDAGQLRTTLLAASLFGIGGAVPAKRYAADAAATASLAATAAGVLAEVDRRRGVAASADDAAAAPAIFGGGFFMLPAFDPVDPTSLAVALGGPAVAPDARTLERWLRQAGRVRAPLDAWRRLEAYVRAAAGKTPSLGIVQVPHEDGARWVGLPFDDETARPPAGRTSLTLGSYAAPNATAAWTGLFLDDWTELIPLRQDETGVAFHYDSPGAEAPNCMLIAVPPGDGKYWDVDMLGSVLNQTLDLARIRAVDGQLLGALGQALPAAFLAANARNDTVSTTFAGRLAGDDVIAHPER